MRPFRLTLGLLLAGAVATAETRIAGSDLLGPQLVPALQEYARRNDVVITTDFAGSHQGWRQLQLGRADLALLTFSPGEPRPAAPYVCLPLASHVTVVLVSEDLPLRQLSFASLTGIFGTTGGTRLTRWGELGLAGEWAARPIAPRIFTEGDGFSTAIFRHVVLHDGAFQPAVTALVAADLHHLPDRLEAGVIILSSQLPPAGCGLKALGIARDEKAVAFAPTPENVDQGDYPMSWPVYLVFRRMDASRHFALLQYLFGEGIARQSAEAGLLPPPPAVRARRIFDLEQL